MHQVLLNIGPLTIWSYGFMMSLGMAGGILLAWVIARKRGGYHEDVFNMGFGVLLAGLAGSRLWEVLFDWDYYSSHLLDIPALWQGGLSVQGAVLGGLLGVVIYTRKRGIPFWEYCDILAPGVLLGQAIGRLGCYLNGCCFGVPASSAAWGVIYPPGTDAHSVFGETPLIPAALYESAWDLAIMGLLLFLIPRKPFHGFIASLYFTIYGAGRIVIESLRADSLTAWGFKTAQATSAATILAALAVMIFLWIKSASTGEKK